MAIVDKIAQGQPGYEDYKDILDAIRFRVHNAYDEKDLPDAHIENRAVLPTANRKMEERVPDWRNLEASKLDRLKDAVIYQAAIEILLSESKPASEDVEGEAIMRYDTLKIADTIKRYEDEINAILPDLAPITGLLVGQFAVFNPKKRF